jgi:hypothetical protein
MARNYKDYDYFANRPDVVKVWEDLEAYHDYCRIELCDFNPADLYRKDSAIYQAYLSSKRPRRPYQGNKPRWDNNNGRRNEQRFSR